MVTEENPVTPSKAFVAIAAMSLNRVIGAQGKIPWHLPEDFKWFKQVTTGHVLLMGRKTFESIGRPLPGRETIVLSRAGFTHPNVRTITDLNELNSWNDPRKIFVCGGAQVYEQMLPRCSELLLTLVKRHVEGDASFPRFEDQFKCVEEIRDTPEFRILRYVNEGGKAG